MCTWFIRCGCLGHCSDRGWPDGRGHGVSELAEEPRNSKTGFDLCYEKIARPSSSTKEKDFKPIVDKLHKLRSDLLQTPFDNGSIITEIDELIKVIMAVKAAVRPLQDYQRTFRSKFLPNLLKHFDTFMPFLTQNDYDINPVLLTVHLKSKYHDALTNKGLRVALEVLYDVKNMEKRAPNGPTPNLS